MLLYPKILTMFQHTAARRRLPKKTMPLQPLAAFQHTAARRRLQNLNFYIRLIDEVSTHSRAEAAAGGFADSGDGQPVSTHSRAEAAALIFENQFFHLIVSTHSRAEAAALVLTLNDKKSPKFQHTAARRRLPLRIRFSKKAHKVSTHSRAEAAATVIYKGELRDGVSTHSRAEAAARDGSRQGRR